MRKTTLIILSLFMLCFISCEEKSSTGHMRTTPSDMIRKLQSSQPNTVADGLTGSRNTVVTPYIPSEFELPINGATGYAAVFLPLYETKSENANIVSRLRAGQAFTILNEENDWWFIRVNDLQGWVLSVLCMINLPDIVPSIIHDNTNTYSSLFKSSGINIPNVTGRALYQSKSYNTRLSREEYIAPVYYRMAGKIHAAQKAAMMEGNTLIIYEAFRPASAHNVVYDELLALSRTNPVVYRGLNTPPYEFQWFLLPAPFNHQRGTAIDVSLARVVSSEVRLSGNYSYNYITRYLEYEMQCPMHELSIRAVVFKDMVSSISETAWMNTTFADNVTHGTVLLHRYLTRAGLSPLASEWWHFNDLENTRIAIEKGITGYYHLTETLSFPPYQF